MTELLGIITNIKNFMTNSDQEILVPVNGEKRVVLSLKKDRIYNIPDFQREIRWSRDNVAMLIEDIKTKPRFLGNIILTKHQNNVFSIIDGQQRITVLTMILNAIKESHLGEIDIIDPCKLIVESFSKFPVVLKQGFDNNYYTDEVIKSDKLRQLPNYEDLWKFIVETEEIQNKRKAKQFMENLEESTFNLIINESNNVGEGIRYFIDVNLKGKQLDVEDIFKSYLFKNDSGDEIRKQWYLLKSTSAEIENSKMEYSLLKLLEHYFLCDLYRDGKYKGMEFGTDFLLKKPYKEDEITYRAGTHLIELIGDNQYMITSLMHLNEIAKIMLLIVKSDSLTEEIKEVFQDNNNGKVIENIELKVIHNIIGKILKDQKILPKALLIKYFSILLYENEGKNKENIRKIYGIYLLTVLFSIFENKKSTEVLEGIIKANEADWYSELVDKINNYFSSDAITDARLLAQYKMGRNEDEEDQRFRCKSLATIYDFFINQNGVVKIRKGKMNELYKFITDSEAFSVEHLIVSETKERTILVQGEEYTIDKSIYKRYVNNFFNFIFIDRDLNSKLKNNWLPKKLEELNENQLSCEYSKMIIEQEAGLGEEFKNRGGKNYKDNLDLFFAREYKEEYIEYTRLALKKIIKRINGYKDRI